MATRAISNWAISLSEKDIPDRTYTAAHLSLYNYLGCAIAGSTHPAVHKAHAALSPFFGPKTCTTFGSRAADKRQATGFVVDAQHAALLNGIASHVFDYDDTHLETIVHPTGPVASALLAYVQYWSVNSSAVETADDATTTTTTTEEKDRQRTVTGRQLLTALIAGIEVECKLALAVWPKHYDVGWHITSTVGSVGAAVAVVKLHSLLQPAPHDEDTLTHAIGIAATQVTGLREMFGSDTKSFHVGRAAQNGLLAALLAVQGFTSSEQGLEALRGWANVVCETGSFKLTTYVDELGKEDKWEVEKNAFKPFPCGIVKHPAIDAAIRLRKEIKESTGDDGLLAAIKKLSFMALVHPLVLELTGKREPKDGLQAKFSVFHGVAVGLLYGKAGPAEYEDAIVTDPDVVAVRGLVNAMGRPDLQRDEAFLHALDPENPPVDGKLPYTVHVEHAIGSVALPMDEAQLQEKFVDQVTLRFGDAQTAKELSDICIKLRDADHVASILESL